MTMRIDEYSVSQHYGRSNLATAIIAALRAAGKDIDMLSLDDLAPVDQFHIQGKESTLRLSSRAGVTTGIRVLDVGGGLGGPARTLANEFGCKVIVLDITEEYCRVGEMLTKLTGLSERVRFQHGSALDMPFSTASFDLVWTQHSSMNIADKQRLYSEIHRVSRPNGRLALHEIMAGAVTPIHFPVPWARQPEISHLSRPEEVRSLLTGIGFNKVTWIDETESAVEWFQQRLATAKTMTGGQPIGLQLLLGEDFIEMFKNQVRNLNESRIAVIQAVFERV